MRKRILGKTGLQVTELGFGAWTIGGVSYGDIEKKDAVDTINSYINAGGNFIDTARRYDASESILGNYFKEYRNREDIILCSKTFAGQKIETIPTIREDVEESLKLMGTSYIDVYYLHQPPDDEDVIEAALTELEKAKEEGLIRHIGASIKGPNVNQITVDLCRKYIKLGRVEVFQVVYSILRQKLYDVILEAQDAGSDRGPWDARSDTASPLKVKGNPASQGPGGEAAAAAAAAATNLRSAASSCRFQNASRPHAASPRPHARTKRNDFPVDAVRFFNLRT